MKKILTKAIMAVMALALIISGNNIVEAADTTPPAVTITAANPSEVEEGGTVVYTVSTSDETVVTYFSMLKSDITMKGFTAKIDIKYVSDEVKTITFSNVQSTSDSTQKYFILGEGVSKDFAGNVSKQKNSPAFTIKEKVVEPPKDTTIPSMTITAANPSTVEQGGKVSYTISVGDEVGIASFKNS